MKKTFLIVFILAAVLELICQRADLPELHQYVKPALMLLLGGYYFFAVPEESRSNLVLFALLLSFFGDSFLLYESRNPVYFMLGLGSFLFAHIFYILAFRQHRDNEDPDQLQTVQKARMAFPVILAATGLVIVLYPRLGDLRFPVVVYAAVLMFMVLNALFRFRRTSLASFWLTFGGAVFFMISDSVLAINKFLEPVPNAGIVIMSFYLLGQFLIVQGLVRHE
jgi:uncharacterized membrane protein YhhN